MSDEKKNPIFAEADEIQSYFKEDLDNLNKIKENLENLRKISKENIDNISGVVAGRGTQHYLIEHINNAISIEAQIQSVIKDQKSIKEKSLDIAIKNNKGEEGADNSDVFSAIQFLLKKEKELEKQKQEESSSIVTEQSEEELDDEIAKKLGY